MSNDSSNGNDYSDYSSVTGSKLTPAKWHSVKRMAVSSPWIPVMHASFSRSTRSLSLSSCNCLFCRPIMTFMLSWGRAVGTRFLFNRFTASVALVTGVAAARSDGSDGPLSAELVPANGVDPMFWASSTRLFLASSVKELSVITTEGRVLPPWG